MLIRPVLESELSLLRKISIKTFVDAFGAQNNPSDMDIFLKSTLNIERLQADHSDPNVLFFYAEKESKVVGFIKVNKAEAQTERFDHSSMELERIYILKDYQGHGIGQKLLEFFEAMGADAGVKMIWLGVWEENLKAITFYQRYGYEQFGKHNYLLGTDLQSDLLFRKMLR